MGNRLGRREKSDKSAVPAIVERKTRSQIAAERAVYFCHPHSSFEKGASERHSGLLRRFAEKGRSAGDMPAQLISKAADWNSSLPRKILGYKTPAEMFEIEILKTAQGAAQRKGRSGAFAATRPQDRLACGFGGLGVWWPLLLRLPLG
ncbi:MAG: hypothetical protein LBU32_24915 [Clostridiales bacterium]|nr:hypothetical protein [Clostridiales bacterium]